MKPVITVQVEPCEHWVVLEPTRPSSMEISYTVRKICRACENPVTGIKTILRAENRSDDEDELPAFFREQQA